MRGGVTDELRSLLRAWYLWPLPPVAAVLAWWLVPLNANLYARFIDSDAQAPDQIAGEYATDVVAVHTSGFSSGYLLAMLAGAVLVLRDRRLAGPLPVVRAASGVGPSFEVRRLFAAKVAAAGLLASVLGPACLVGGLPRAHAAVAHHWALSELPQRGVSIDELTLWDPQVLMVVVSGLLAFPAWAAVGVGLGGILGRWWRLAILAALPVVTVVGYRWGEEIAERSGLAGAIVVGILIVLAVGWGILVGLSLSACAPVYVLLVAGAAAVALLDGQRATRRRLARAASAPIDVLYRNRDGGDFSVS